VSDPSSTKRGLYSAAELFGGFESGISGSYAETLDALTYISSQTDQSLQARMDRAVHDQLITDARDAFLVGHNVVAIMGGHSERRDSTVYRTVASIAQTLAKDFLLTSGGGPGAMEATHLGAMCKDESTLTDALRTLSRVPEFPHGLAQLAPKARSSGERSESEGSGHVEGIFDLRLLGSLHQWQIPAFEVLEAIPQHERNQSLSIPTWFYGHEPPTPFATHIAKYFHNAIREDGLLAIAHDGIIYAPGKAGTLQEVFQDAAQNYYQSFGRFSPMAFLDVDNFWSERFPVEKLLRPLFGEESYARWVLIHPDPDEIIHFLRSSRDRAILTE
jgi:predicted Rossmann-fold nucleotide-binding protein